MTGLYITSHEDTDRIMQTTLNRTATEINTGQINAPYID